MEIFFGTKWWWSGLIIFLFFYLGLLSGCLGVFLMNSKWFYEKSKLAALQRGVTIEDQYEFSQSKKFWAVIVAIFFGYMYIVPFARIHKVQINGEQLRFKNAWNIPLGSVHTSDIVSIEAPCSRNVKYGYTSCKVTIETSTRKYRTLWDRDKEINQSLIQLEDALNK